VLTAPAAAVKPLLHVAAHVAPLELLDELEELVVVEELDELAVLDELDELAVVEELEPELLLEADAELGGDPPTTPSF
jgi:hypothetical protein